MHKIDIHTHILPPSLPNFKQQFGYGGFIELQDCPGCRDKNMMLDSGKFFRRVLANAYDPEERLKEYDAFGVRTQVLSTVPVMFNYWTKPQDGLIISKFLNDHLAEVVARNPERFIGLGTLPLQSPDLAVREAERCMRELKLSGFQIGSHVGEWNLSAPELFPVYEACQDLNACIFVHPWDMMGQEQMPKYWLPWLVGMPAETTRAMCSLIFGGVFAKFPKLRFAFAHGGGAFAYTLGRIQHGFEVRPDLVAQDNATPPQHYLGHFWVDSLVHSSRALKFLAETVGAEKICLGSDYPFPLGEDHPGSLINSSDFTADQKEWMNHRAALKWLGING